MTQPSGTPSLVPEEIHPTKDRRERETHEIHTSENRSYRGCRRRWDWAYRQGYVLSQSPKPLELGIAFHIGMQTFYNPETWETTTKEEKASNAVQAFTLECERQREKFLRTTRQERVMVAEGDDYAERIDLGIGMIEHYANHIHPTQDNWFRPVMVEVPFRVPLLDTRPEHKGDPIQCWNPGTDPGQCGQHHPRGAPVTFDGRIDMIVEDIANGGYLVWDHKSAAAVQANDYILHMDDQVAGYSWALRSVLEIDIRGFVYAEYKKDYPKPPGTLKKVRDGKLFSVNKQQGTSLEVFVETVDKYDHQAYMDGKYAEYIAWLGGKDAMVYHKRFVIVKTPYELDQVGYNLSMQAAEMVNPSLPIYPAPGKFSCSGCAYYAPCRGKNAGEDIEYTLSTLYEKVK
jgi:hypothetical protein